MCCIKQMFAWTSSASMKVRNKRNRSNFTEANGFVKKRKNMVFVVAKSILIIFKKFCQSELLICYYIDISALGGLFDRFWTILFYHKP